MGNAELDIEKLEQMISDFQKQIAIKREALKSEIENEDSGRIDELQQEVLQLKDKVLFSQGELRKLYLKKGNVRIETEHMGEGVQSENLNNTVG